MAHAGSAPTNNNRLWITDLSTTSTGNVVHMGQPVHFVGHIVGGILCNKNATTNCQKGFLNNTLTTWGYHLFWFFGMVNGTGNESNVTAFKQNYQVSNCDTNDTVCSVNTTIQATTTYSHPGTYVVSLTAYDANFDYDIDTTQVVVVPPSFHVRINNIQPLQNLSGHEAFDEGIWYLYNGSCVGNCSGVVLQWQYGDGSTGYGSLSAHNYSESGTHVVTLTGIDESAEALNRTFATVSVGDTAPLFYPPPKGAPAYKIPEIQRNSGVYSPIVNFNLSQTTNVFVGEPLGFCAVGYDWNIADGNILSFKWSFGDGDMSYTRVTPTPDVPAAARYVCDNSQLVLGPNHLGQSLYGGLLSEYTGVVARGEYSLTRHSYSQPGYYNVSVTVYSEGLLNMTYNFSIPVHVVALSTPSGGWSLPTFKVPVGQVALLNASKSLTPALLLPGFPTTLAPSTNAFYNYSWNAGALGHTYGSIGRVTSFTPLNQSINLTTTANTSALPSAGSTPTVGESHADFFDVKPTVGIDSLYTEATITLTVENPAAYNYLNFTLYENGQEWGYYNMSYYVDYNTVTLAPLQFQMSDRWTVGLQYTPYGSSGGSYVDVKFAWKDDNTQIDGYDSTEPDTASDTVSAFFSDSNTTVENHLNFSLNAQALGEPIFGSVVFFSPAQTHLAETWSWGDGTHSYTNTSKPSTPEPTLDTWLFEAAYDVGANYTFKMTACDPLGYCGSDQIEIDSYYNLTVNDTAPTIYLPHAGGFSPSTVEDTINAYNATIVNQDNASGPATVTWQYGDGTNSTNTTSGGDVTTSHVYQYGAQYALVVYAESPRGSTTVNWTFVKVSNPVPRANFTVSPAVPFVGGVTTFSGVNSSDVNGNPSGLSFGWLFGNGHSSGFPGDQGATATSSYGSSGTYTATLIVQDEEGSTVSVSHAVTVATGTPTAPFPTVTPSNATADTFSSFAVSIPAASIFMEIPLVNVTWSWGDGSGPSWGLTTGHTFLYPGDYAVNATLSAPGITSPYTASTTVRVVDGSPVISLPYEGDEEYGGNHTASFTAVILGDYADRGKSWNVTWSLGDGNITSTTGGNVSSVTHVYIQEGLLTVRVNASGPYPTFGAPSVSTQFSLMSVPDFDNDGLPNAYETLVTHTSNAYADSTDKTGMSGTGCTDYVGANCESIPGVGSYTADTDGDGLTNIQEVLGSVTGYPSNPLDANTAGDGIPDGAHFFSDSYPEERVVPLSTPGLTYVDIPNATYQGFAPAFNQSRLLLQLNTTDPCSDFTVTLVSPGQKEFPLALGTAQCTKWPVVTFYLLNSTPTNGASSAYGLSLGDFETPEASAAQPWVLDIVDTGSGGGTVPEATISVSYYTNPSLADPTHSGLLEGHGLTTPIFNCSAPTNENYSSFNPSNFAVSKITFWPYTETYWKLSVEQGVPYVPGHNRSLGATNNATGGCPVAGDAWAADTASYLGDADFGISPWNAHFAGDPLLTNGMKALGRYNYTLTKDQYVSTSGGVVPALSDNGYPSDPISYEWPLNPTALSTAGDGIPDSKAIDPVAPLALEVHLNWINDSGGCYSGTPNEIAGMRVTNGSGIPPIPSRVPGLPPIVVDPVVYSLTNSNPVGPKGTCGTLGNYHQGFTFNFYATYLLPVSDALNNSYFSLEFDLWPTGTVSASAASAYDATIRGASITLGATYYTNGGNSTTPCPSGGTNVCATVTVIALQRAPLVLMNLSGEVENLSGYGYRYTGEQQFYSFYMNLPNGPSAPTKSDPFQSGVNLVLESRSAFLNSTLGSTLNGTSPLPGNLTNCFGSSAQITTQNPGSTDFTSIVGSFSADQVATSCALTLLGELEPRSANRTNGDPPMGGTYLFLSSVQAELLGLGSQALTLMPFQSPSTNATGGPPTNDLGSAFGYVVGAFAFAYNALVVAANFIANLPAELKALGQLILGALEQFLHGLEAAVQAMAGILDDLLAWAVSVILLGVTDLLKPILSFIQSAISGINSNVYGAANATADAYNGTGSVSAASRDWSTAGSSLDVFTPVSNGIQLVLDNIPDYIVRAINAPSIIQNDITNLFVSTFTQLVSFVSPSSSFTNTVKGVLNTLSSPQTLGFDALSSFTQEVFNLTSGYSSTQVNDPGDYWQFVIGTVIAVSAFALSFADVWKAFGEDGGPEVYDALAFRTTLWSVAATVIIESVLTNLGAPGTNESNQCKVLATFVPIDMLFSGVGVLFGALAALKSGGNDVALVIGLAVMGIGLLALALDVKALQTTIKTCG